MNDIRDRYWSSLDFLIESNKEIIQLNRDKHNIGDIGFSREFATVRVAMGRRMGTTTYIARNAARGDCVICFNYRQKSDFKKINDLWHFNENPEILCLENLDPKKYNYNKVWVDCASVISDVLIREIYGKLSFRATQFIFLG